MRGQHVDVRRAFPIGTRLEAIRIAECDVAPWKLLVLQEVADDLRQPHVGADRELSHPTRIRILGQVFANVGGQLRVGRLD